MSCSFHIRKPQDWFRLDGYDNISTFQYFLGGRTSQHVRNLQNGSSTIEFKMWGLIKCFCDEFGGTSRKTKSRSCFAKINSSRLTHKAVNSFGGLYSLQLC